VIGGHVYKIYNIKCIFIKPGSGNDSAKETGSRSH